MLWADPPLRPIIQSPTLLPHVIMHESRTKSYWRHLRSPAVGFVGQSTSLNKCGFCMVVITVTFCTLLHLILPPFCQIKWDALLEYSKGDFSKACSEAKSVLKMNWNIWKAGGTPIFVTLLSQKGPWRDSHCQKWTIFEFMSLGPTIQSSFAARREAQDLVFKISKNLWTQLRPGARMISKINSFLDQYKDGDDEHWLQFLDRFWRTRMVMMSVAG